MNQYKKESLSTKSAIIVITIVLLLILFGDAIAKQLF